MTASGKSATIVGKDDLVHQVAAKAGTNLKETNGIIDAFTQVVREGVAKGKEVRLMGFGTWNLRNVAARKVKSIRGGTPHYHSSSQTGGLLRSSGALAGSFASQSKSHQHDQTRCDGITETATRHLSDQARQPGRSVFSCFSMLPVWTVV
jgi:DNA-binding protein HU-beta